MKYDTIVVGAGTAGCILAARLSEDPHRAVLLLEAGPDFADFAHLPPMLKYGWGEINLEARQAGAPYNWSFVGTANAQQATPMPVPRGKVVGGSSAINGQTFIRGAPEDFDTWAAWGNDEWSYLKACTQPLHIVMSVQTNLRTQAQAHVTLCSSDLPLAYASLVDSSNLRFQSECNFLDAKQSWGLEDFMHVTPTGVTDTAHLSLCMVNVAYRRRLQPDTQAKRPALATLEAHLGKLRQGLARLIDSYAEGRIDKDEFEPRISRLRQRLARLEEPRQHRADEAAMHTE